MVERRADGVSLLPLDSDTRHQLALGVREAITNALRHAQAKEIAITLALSKTELVIGVVIVLLYFPLNWWRRAEDRRRGSTEMKAPAQAGAV